VLRLVLGRDLMLTKFVFKWFRLRKTAVLLASYQVTISDDQLGQGSGGSQEEDDWCKRFDCKTKLSLGLNRKLRIV